LCCVLYAVSLELTTTGSCYTLPFHPFEMWIEGSTPHPPGVAAVSCGPREAPSPCLAVALESGNKRHNVDQVMLHWPTIGRTCAWTQINREEFLPVVSEAAVTRVGKICKIVSIPAACCIHMGNQIAAGSKLPCAYAGIGSGCRR